MMKIREGFCYHLNDNYYELVKGCGVKYKNPAGRTYPAYCCHIEKSVSAMWMIPMSTKVEKYKDVCVKETEKYGRCLSVVFGEFDGRRVAFQVQDMFPVRENHILHPHTRKGKIITVTRNVRDEIRDKFHKLRELDQNGIPCVFPDIKRVERLIYNLAD